MSPTPDPGLPRGHLEPPTLTGEARAAVEHRGSHLQIIACAGSGKTEVVAQRVADLLATGADPSSIVAFTFTERAADSLKSRIETRVAQRLGAAFLDRLNGCFVGTIHAYCFRLLQQHVPVYETYDVLDEHRLAAFLARESYAIGLRDLVPGKLYDSMRVFMVNVDVVENELIDVERLDEPFRSMVVRFRELLERHRFLTYGQQIARAVAELRKPDVYQSVHSQLRHLIVDEYQDINPAQERLIELLAAPPVELCVVGDDDQSIYQWRGSDVGNIVTFADRYPGVARFEVVVNRRSRPEIIATANGFATTIEGRLTKQMRQHRDARAPEVVTWTAPREADEADLIARSIRELHDRGLRYRDVAILVRASTSYKQLLAALARHGVPVLPAGLTGLFVQPEAQLFGRTFAYLAGYTWRESAHVYAEFPVELDELGDEYTRLFQLDAAGRQRVWTRLAAWRVEVQAETRPANLVGDYYALLADCGVAEWDLADPQTVARLGALARCSSILVDYESVRRRARPDPNAPGEAIGGQDRGPRYFGGLATHIQNWALSAYEGFEGEEDITLDAVDLTTIHKAKGLEWPVVFVPCVSANRFPASRTGQARDWRLPADCFDRRRYEGSVNDERRLFYVAMTRARDWLSVSSHNAVTRNRVEASPFLKHVAGGDPPSLAELPLPDVPPATGQDEELLSITYSELAGFRTCGLAYRMRTLIGFQPPLTPEFGYGKAVHHVLRGVAEHTRAHGQVPSPTQLGATLDREFFLPAAGKVAHGVMKQAARRLVERYIADYGDDLRRVWAVERPFELHTPSAIISGRADVILDMEGGEIASLALVDYKTSTDPDSEYDLQLQVYADAGRREGLNVRAAYVHDLDAAMRLPIDTTDGAIQQAEVQVEHLIGRLKARDFVPTPGPACVRCDVRPLCRYAV